MNQIRIKWVFVILFLFINLFLGYLLYQSQWQATSISEETIAHVVSILEKRNVLIEGTLIPKSNHKMREVSVKNIVEDSSSFVASLKVSDWKKTEQGFFRGDETIVFEDESFTYTGKIPLEKGLSGEALSKAVQKHLRKINLNTEGIKLKTIEQMEDGERLEYVQTYENYEIFGTRLMVTVKDADIIKITGIWMESVNIQSKKQDTLFATEALVRFAEEENHTSPVRITEIRSGYYISELDENVSHKVMQMLPGFQVTTASGAKFYYDARNPQQ